MNPKLISCRVMIDEIKPFLPEQFATEVLEISLHVNPEQLHGELQRTISASDGLYDPIYLGYGLCSKAVVGLLAERSRMIIPKSDDCIEIFLGSREARLYQIACEPGTYFLTQGNIGDGSPMIFSEYERSLAKYGKEKADKLLTSMMSHYRRLVYIRMPNSNTLERDRQYAADLACRLGLRYEEICGDSEWLRRMIAQEWDDNFVVVPPGERIKLEHFLAV